MEITHKKIFFTGVFLLLVLFLGVPVSWKFFLIGVSAVVLMVMSITLELPKQFSTRGLRMSKQNNTAAMSNQISHPIAPVSSPNTSGVGMTEDRAQAPRMVQKETFSEGVSYTPKPRIRTKPIAPVTPVDVASLATTDIASTLTVERKPRKKKTVNAETNV
jgi:uncharacterized protein (DUF58 family)